MKGDVLFDCVKFCNEDEEIKHFLKLSRFLIIIIKQPPRLANKEVGAGFLKTLPLNDAMLFGYYSRFKIDIQIGEHCKPHSVGAFELPPLIP